MNSCVPLHGEWQFVSVLFDQFLVIWTARFCFFVVACEAKACSAWFLVGFAGRDGFVWRCRRVSAGSGGSS